MTGEGTGGLTRVECQSRLDYCRGVPSRRHTGLLQATRFLLSPGVLRGRARSGAIDGRSVRGKWRAARPLFEIRLAVARERSSPSPAP